MFRSSAILFFFFQLVRAHGHQGLQMPVELAQAFHQCLILLLFFEKRHKSKQGYECDEGQASVTRIVDNQGELFQAGMTLIQQYMFIIHEDLHIPPDAIHRLSTGMGAHDGKGIVRIFFADRTGSHHLEF